MNLSDFLKRYAEKINGSYSEYDSDRSVIVVSLEDERVQAVIGEKDDENGTINLSSKVCLLSDFKDDFKMLLEQNHQTVYGKFAIDNEFIKVESKLKSNEASEETLETIIMEIAQLADSWEFKLTGKDIF
ncbi:YbjN domain-containing protein [Reichenbachiella ulvae]|uniref:YbjN domain-containing protein n=1 Tax=Reichenbachiella ulvae TaxID=2980104 RepID=A0ABT3CT55_9BACT|nr:YbjN domain-containing protein [Reichenbachiella ulvae]MCV9386782.1 YbjN domain-containing protein [Reichenbachiella ulvae]